MISFLSQLCYEHGRTISDCQDYVHACHFPQQGDVLSLLADPKLKWAIFTVRA